MLLAAQCIAPATGSTYFSGQARFFIRPVPAEEEQPARLEAELWRGPLTRELSEILETASFPMSEEGLEKLTAWLEARAAELNG